MFKSHMFVIRNRSSAFSALTAAALAISLAAAALAEPPVGDRDRRRTPVVEVYEKSRDAIVNISTTRVVRYQSLRYESVFDEMFDMGRPITREQRVQSVGSGFVVHPSGYVVTNHHVVAQTSDISVIFVDKREKPAKVVAVDPDHDLAVLKVESDTPLPYLPLGRSNDIMIGETVIAIGNPLGLQNTVTSGIVSALGRDIPFNNEMIYRGLIQTDAAINPGNSGGPLLNLNGELIGINSAIRGDAQNVGFAIPVDRLWELLPSMLDIERRMRVRFGLHVGGHEALVNEVTAKSPAAEAGLKAGDRVRKFDGEPIRDSIDYFVHLLDRKPGDTVALSVERDRKLIEAKITLEAAPPPDGEQLAAKLLGLNISEVPAALRRKYDLDANSGVWVREVAKDSPARQYIAPGDLIVQLNQVPITSPAALGLALETVKPGDTMSIVGYGVRRGTPIRWHVSVAAK